MRVIPVIDLKQGNVVRGVAGRRDDYRPIVSRLCDEPSPAAVGAAFRRLGFNEAYVADLDAIAGSPPDYRAYEQLFACGLRLLVDAGLATARHTAELAAFSCGEQLSGVVIGLESVCSPAELAASVEIATPSRLLFSLDLHAGRPVTRLDQWQSLLPEAIANEVISLGVRRLVVLDVAQVGMGEGVSTLALCQRLRQCYAGLEIISGGGVRNVEDLSGLAAAGCDAALVASALHDGRLTSSELTPFLT